MANIPLRTYLNEIENLINRSEIEPAIAHAKNILHSHPKYIAAYRLLGQAYLEGKRYGEAADVFRRVLAVIPDDFVASVGLSIIREDERNLDLAIWHMERAYEMQPFNPAVQEELRRLYGKRDEVVPPKIRLTRGALVRMYIRGELFTQAIAEARAALAEDPQRYDLQVLLAKVYLLSGQKIEATEVCSDLINKLPYCYEANRILAQILPETSRAEDAERFRQRVIALDPYAAFQALDVETTETVPDQAVLIEPFIWDADAAAAQPPSWAQTIGMDWTDTVEDSTPDWMSADSADSQAEQQPTENLPPSSEEFLPDWMKEAGWNAAAGSEQENVPAAFDPGSDEEEAQAAELPDWLRSIAPQGAFDPEEDQRSEWLENILEAPQQPSSSEAEFATAEPTPPLGDDERLPDWFASSEEDITPQPEPAAPDTVEIPDWMLETEPGNEQVGETPAEAEALPDWLSSLEEPETPAGEPEISVETAQPAGEAEQPAESVDEELPEWFTNIEGTGQPMPEQEAEQVTQAPAPADSEDAPLPDWLAQIEEETVQDQQTSAETDLPDWMGETTQEPAQSLEAQATADAETLAPVEPSLEGQVEQAEGTSPDWSDLDSAMAWLEGLAARQGADEATLTTAPEERGAAMPDWLQQQVEPETVEQTVEQAVQDQQEQADAEELPEWLQEVRAEAQETEGEAPATAETSAEEPAQAADMPDWLAQIVAEEEETAPYQEQEMPAALVDEPEPAQPIEQPAAQVEETPAETDEVEEALAWLEDIEPTEQKTTVPDESIQAEMPDWLQSTADEAAADEIFQPQDLTAQAPVEETSQLMEEDLQRPVPLEPSMQNSAADGEMPDLSSMSEEEMFAWLESLAARQGADEATLLTEPDDRPEPAELSSIHIVEEEAGAGEAEPVLVEPAVPHEAAEPPAVEEPVQASAESVPEWLQGIEAEESTVESVSPWETTFDTSADEPLPEPSNLPDWLEAVSEQPAAQQDAVPDWLQGIASEPAQDALPAEEIPAAESVVQEPEVSSQAAEPEPAWSAPVEETEEVETATQPAAKTLPEVRAVLERGNIDSAVEGYDRLLQEGTNLPEIIQDLRDALYRYPVNTSLWQALGDAYARNDQLQEAIDAYTKAEDLLR